MTKKSHYSLKLILSCLVFCALIPLAIILIKHSVIYTPAKTVEYTEKSNLDYQVYLKPNDFYDTPYLEKNMSYVSSLVDYFKFNFDYTFTANANEDIEFYYDLTSKITITDGNDKQYYDGEEVTILPGKIVHMDDTTNFSINEEIKLDYDTYNDFATNYKNTTGINTVSALTITMKIVKTNLADGTTSFGEPSIISVKIPLTEKTINIELDCNEVNTSDTIEEKEVFKLRNLYEPIIAAGSTLIAIIFIIIFISLLRQATKKNPYDVMIKRILRDYDRFIVETTTPPTNFTDDKIVIIKSFKELLDVHDTINEPIMYANIIDHKKCKFYITHQDKLYVLTIQDSQFKK